MCYAFMTGATSRVPILRSQTEIWKQHATLSWQKPPPKSLSRYIELWGRLLVCLHEYGYYLVITWIWINRMHYNKLEPNYIRIDLLYRFYTMGMYFVINYIRLDLLYEFYSLIMDFVIYASCKNWFISNTCALACSSSYYLLIESCTYYVFFHCF